MKSNRLFYILFIVIFSGISMASVLYARPYGRTGRSGKQGGTCSNCHFGTDTPELTLSTPDSIMPGETIDLVFTVRRTSADPLVTTAGFNVATEAGTISGRGETPEACTDTTEPAHTNVTCISEFEGDLEIAHARPAILQDGEMAFEFSWTAPITPGTYLIYGTGVTAVSGAGAFNNNIHPAAISTTLTVEDSIVPGNPIAAFTSTPDSEDGLTVQFDASGSTDDGSITTYVWAFGDGSYGEGVTASHTYAAEGSYSVILEVTDNEGLKGSVTKTVLVSSSVGSDNDVYLPLMIR